MKNQALIKLTEERINTNNQLIDFVERAKAVTTPLFPETVQFTEPSLKFGAAIISVDSKNPNDVYTNESGSLSLHLKKIKEIADAAGVIWVDSKIEERKYDEHGKVTYSRIKVWGKLKSVDGTIKESVAAGTYDYYMDLNKFKSEKQINQRRFKADQLAESNAKFRCLQDLLVKLPNAFSPKDLEKPFLIPYVIEDKNELLKDLPKEVQQDIKKQVAMKRLGLMETIYPSSPAQTKQVEEAVVMEVQTAEPEKELGEKPSLSKEEINRINAETFLGAPQKERSEQIMRLIKLKGYKDPNGAVITEKRIENNDVKAQVNFIERLLNMPDYNPEENMPL